MKRVNLGVVLTLALAAASFYAKAKFGYGFREGW